MNSKSFSTQIRPAGQEFRSGVIGEVISDIHHDVDVAFKSLETATGYGWAPCRVAYDTAEDTTFAGGGKDAVDGVTMAVGDRILVTGQNTAKNNGIYVVTALGAGVDDATWERANDLNATSEVALGYKVRVLYGNVYALSDWQVTTAPAVLGTNNLVFTQITAALTATTVRALVKATSEGEFDALAAAGVIDGDRLKADGLTAANLKAALAPDSLDFSDSDIAAAVKAGTLPASKLSAGGATGGIDGGDVRFLAEVAGGGTLPVTGTPELVFAVTIPDAAGDIDFTVGPQKVVITDVHVVQAAGGNPGNSYTLSTAAGALPISNAIAGAAATGAVGRASSLENATVLGGASLQLTVVKAGGSVAGTLLVRCVPVA